MGRCAPRSAGQHLVLACLLAFPTVDAQPIYRYEVRSATAVIEVTAPRADILRIRAGAGELPEDASYATTDAARAGRTALDATQEETRVTLRTGKLTAIIDRRTLALSVEDAQGHVLLADADGGGLSFERGGYRLRKSMPPDAHYFALGDKAGALDRRDGSYTLWNSDHYGFGPGSDPLYKSIPFVLTADESGRASGWFVDNHWRLNFDFGKAARDVLELSAEGGPVDYYVLAGPEPRSVVESYAWLTGTPPLLPLWALGFQQSHYSYLSQQEVIAVADRLRSERIPADVLYLDIDYQDRNRPFTIDAQAFPDMAGLVGHLSRQGLQLVMITDLHVAEASGEGYLPYDSGLAADAFLSNPDGSIYTGKVWPGSSVFPDFSRESVRDWWGRQYTAFSALGVGGFWNDMNEPALFDVRSKTMPLDIVHHIDEPGRVSRAASHAEMHNVYGMLNSRATYEGLKTLRPDRRPFVLTRATYAGGQRYATTWTGDNLSRWDQLNLSVAMLVNLGLSGFAYAGDDIGGFAGETPTPELLTRWIQLGAFNPLFRDHYAKGKSPQEPWVGDAEHEAIRRRYIEERYRLMPYVYGLAEEASRTGIPMIRPVFLEFPQVLAAGENLGGTGEQFLFGPSLLVAPSPSPESAGSYAVRLPDPGWYDYWTGQRLTAAQITETPVLARLPVYVRPGSVLPKAPLVQSTAQRPQGPLTLAVYPGPDCHGSLYLDDGISLDYQRGGYLRQDYACRESGDGFELDFGARTGSYAPWWSEIRVEVHGLARAGAATIDGRRVAAFADAGAGMLVVTLPDARGPARLRIAPPSR